MNEGVILCSVDERERCRIFLVAVVVRSLLRMYVPYLQSSARHLVNMLWIVQGVENNANEARIQEINADVMSRIKLCFLSPDL